MQTELEEHFAFSSEAVFMSCELEDSTSRQAELNINAIGDKIDNKSLQSSLSMNLESNHQSSDLIATDSFSLDAFFEQSFSQTPPHPHALLLYLGDSFGAERAVRSAARYASQLNVKWYVVTIDDPSQANALGIKRYDILAMLRLAESLGAQTSVLFGYNISETLMNHTRKLRCTTLVLVRPLLETKRRYNIQTLAQRLATQLPEIDVIEIVNPSTKSATKPASKFKSLQSSSPQLHLQTFSYLCKDYCLALAICLITLLIAVPLEPVFESTTLIMLFLLAVMIVGLIGGKGPAAMTAIINAIVFDLFFVGARLTLSILDLQYVLTFAVMLSLGLLIGQLTAGLRHAATLAAQRESKTYSLFELTRNLSAALTTEQVIHRGKHAIEQAFGGKAEIVLLNEIGQLKNVSLNLHTQFTNLQRSNISCHKSQFSLRIAKWVLMQKQSAGFGTSFFRDSAWHYMLLDSTSKIRGVLALQPDNRSLLFQTEQMRHLQTLANQIAIAEERIHYGKLAQQANLQVEAQDLRNTMLSAMSHDLRTPLTVLSSMAQSCLSLEPLNISQKQHIQLMIEQTHAITKLADNLLEMARLQSGALNLCLDWQSVEEVIGSAIRQVKHGQHHFDIQTEIESKMPLVQFDAVMIERVLVNLIENALKYGVAPIEIKARFRNGKLCISVRDHGKGLPTTLKGRENKLFETFTRGEQESAKVGVGLGLAIVKAIIKAHQGEVFAENANGKGAVFSFYLPTATLPSSLEE